VRVQWKANDMDRERSISAQHTLGHRQCPACAEKRQSITMSGVSFANLLFHDAAKTWLEGRKKIGLNTRKYYLCYIAALMPFFGEMRLAEIDIGNIAEYQTRRQEEVRLHRRHKASNVNGHPKDHDGASLINHELSCLGQILQRAGMWKAVSEFYEPLPLPPEGPGIALDPDEEQHLFQVGAKRKRWAVAYYASLLSRSTSAGPGEIRHLRLGDVRLNVDEPGGPMIRVLRHSVEGGVKNEFRERPLPLNPDALKAVEWMLERAHELGACEPHHFLLPHRAAKRGEKADPTRPMGSWKRAHRAMCVEAGKKFPRIAKLRPYDFRHTAATDMMEDPSVSWTTIEHILGHRIDSKTKRKYDHIRNDKLRAAADALHRGHVAVRAAIPPIAVAQAVPVPVAVQSVPAASRRNIGFGAVVA
jgi:integrase